MNIQKQISKQSQLIDQNFSNEIMLNAIASLENLAIFYGYKGKRVFDYYSGYADRKDEKSLIDAVVLQLHIFRASHSNYMENYDDYHFPRNLTKNQIIKQINEWKSFIYNKNIAIFYDEMINYLGGNSSKSGIEDIIVQKRKEFGPTTKKDLQKISNASPYINTHIFNQMDVVKESIQKTGDYQINAHLNKQREENKLLKDIGEIEKKCNEKNKAFMKKEKSMEESFENLQRKICDRTATQEDVKILDKKMNDFKAIFYDVPLEQKYINSKIDYYTKCYKKSEYLEKKNPNMKIIKAFSEAIGNIYNMDFIGDFR